MIFVGGCLQGYRNDLVVQKGKGSFKESSACLVCTLQQKEHQQQQKIEQHNIEPRSKLMPHNKTLPIRGRQLLAIVSGPKSPIS